MSKLLDICNDKEEKTKDELIALLQEHYPNSKMLEGANPRLIHINLLKRELCSKICHGIKFSGHTENIIDDIEYVGKNVFTYKGKQVGLTIKNLALDGTFGFLDRATFIDDPKKSFIIKQTKKDRLEEVKVINKHLPATTCEGLVKMKKIPGKELIDFVIMPTADGDLYDLASTRMLNIYQIDRIISVIQKVLQCLFENGVYYFDLKPANILYQCKSDTELNIFLGDIGSIIPVKKVYIATYPTPDYFNGLIPEDITEDQAMDIYKYQIAILYCIFITGRTGRTGPLFSESKDSLIEKISSLSSETERLIGKNKYSDFLKAIK